MRFRSLLLVAALSSPALAFTTSGSSNAYMVENTSGTNNCYDFITTPNCAASITNLTATISSGSIPSGSTNYIQNSGNPTTSTQQFSVQTSSVTGTESVSTLNVTTSLLLNSQAGTAGQVPTSNGPGLAPTYQTSGSALLSSTNTWTGGQTFSSATISNFTVTGNTSVLSKLNITNIAPQLFLSPSLGNGISISAASPATASRTVTIPDPTANATFILSQGTFSIAGSGTIGSASQAVTVGVSSTNSCGYVIGTIVQIVSSAAVTSQGITSVTFSTATVWNTPITLKCISDKVRVTWTGAAITQANTIFYLTLAQSLGIDLAAPGTNGLTANDAQIATNDLLPLTMIAYDSPGNLGPITYVIKAKSSSGTVQICDANNNQTTCRMILEEIAQ